MKQIYVISLGVLALAVCNAGMGSYEKNMTQFNSSFLGSMLADSQETQAPQGDDGTAPNTPAGRAVKGKNATPDANSDATSDDQETSSEPDEDSAED